MLAIIILFILGVGIYLYWNGGFLKQTSNTKHLTTDETLIRPQSQAAKNAYRKDAIEYLNANAQDKEIVGATRAALLEQLKKK